MPLLTEEGRDWGRFSFVVVVDTVAVVVFVRSAGEVLRCVSVVKGTRENLRPPKLASWWEEPLVKIWAVVA